MSEIVIIAVGPDRPGMVDELTGELHSRGANIADSRMVNLRGQFALILLAQARDGNLATLTQTLHEAGRKVGLTVHVTSPSALNQPELEYPVVKGVQYRLRAYAMDQPGIVHRISHLLHGHGINIEELQTHLEQRPYGSPPVFTLELRMTVPPEVPIRKLREELAGLGESINCDVELDPGTGRA